MYIDNARGLELWDEIYKRTEETDRSVKINVQYSSTQSDSKTIMQIHGCVETDMPFALKGENNTYIFLPHLLQTFFIGNGDNFIYPSKEKFIDGLKLIYLTHKNLIVGNALDILIEKELKKIK